MQNPVFFFLLHLGYCIPFPDLSNYYIWFIKHVQKHTRKNTLHRDQLTAISGRNSRFIYSPFHFPKLTHYALTCSSSSSCRENVDRRDMLDSECRDRTEMAESDRRGVLIGGYKKTAVTMTILYIKQKDELLSTGVALAITTDTILTFWLRTKRKLTTFKCHFCN